MAKKAAGKKAAQKAPGQSGAAVAEDAQFVFRGLVLQRGASTLTEVPATGDTIVVRVEEILHAPDVLQGLAGESITVQLGPGQSVEDGREYLFHTKGWVYGASLGVICVALEPAGPGVVESARTVVGAARATRLKERAQRADAVVTGQVTDVNPVPAGPDAAVSEHDPEWHEAHVRVDSVVRGKRKPRVGKSVVVRFAASRDVRWAHTPKLSPGLEGVWMLGDKTTERKTMRALAAVPADQYLIVDPDDFHPKEQVAQVLSLIK